MSSLAMSLAAAMSLISFDCTIVPPKSISVASVSDSRTTDVPVGEGIVRRTYLLPGVESAMLVPVDLPHVSDSDWKFRLILSAGKDKNDAEVVWERDPVQIAGTYKVFTTGPDAAAFVTNRKGPCLFTEGACASLVQLVSGDSSSAGIIITPTATTTKEDGSREPFLVVLRGTCLHSEVKK